MGALDKFKSLFFGQASKPASKKVQRPKSCPKPNLKIVPKHSVAQTSHDKQDIRALQAKINQKISRDPKLASNAALIIEKMLQKK
jgi:hypothetical protein